MSLYCFENSRTPEQLAEMRRLEEQRICLFCPETLESHQQQKVLWQSDHWIVTPNEFPYTGASLHLLLVPKDHVVDMLDLSSESRGEFWEVLSDVRRRFGLGFYGLGVRNGDCRYTGGTISHVHVHVIVGSNPDTEDEGSPVRMRFSSTPRRAPR